MIKSKGYTFVENEFENKENLNNNLRPSSSMTNFNSNNSNNTNKPPKFGYKEEEKVLIAINKTLDFINNLKSHIDDIYNASIVKFTNKLQNLVSLVMKFTGDFIDNQFVQKNFIKDKK